MAVRKRGDRWWVDIHYGGQRIRESCGAKATRADALRYEQKILADLFDQRLGKKRQRLITEVATAWIKGDLSRLKSRKQTIEHLRRLGPHITGKTLQEAPQAAREVIEAGILIGNSNATINRRLALLRRLCNLAWRWEWIDAPIRITLLCEHSERHVYLTVDQVQRLADACTLQAARDMVLLAAFTGLRRSEMFKLTADSLMGEWIVLDADTKSGRPRSVPVATLVVRQIMQRMPLPITVPVLRRQFEAARVIARMPDVRFHDLRHTYASWLVQSGVPLRAVQELLGHSTIAVTQRYAHLAPAHLADGVAQAMRLIGAADSRHESVTAPEEKARK